MRVTYLPVDEKGMISLDQLEDAICEETCMISVMFANNEIGTIQPIDDIGKIATKYNICFHTDAVQAYMHLRINVHDMAISMLSASAHKFGGPKGVGFCISGKISLLERLCTEEVRNGICGVVRRMYPVLQGWEKQSNWG